MKRTPGALAAPSLAALLLLLVVACDSSEPGEASGSCPPLQAPANQEEGAQAVLDLIEDQSDFVQTELPGWELRHIFVPQAANGPVTFLYAPTPSKGTPATLVSRTADGSWQLAQDERAPLPDNMPVLDLTSLRLGPETVAATAEASVPGLETAGVGLAREGCELTWFVGGFVMGPDGQPREVVEGVVPDATGEFELRERYDAPGGRR